MRKILSAALALLLVLSSFTGTVLFEHVHAEAAEAISYKDATLFELKTLTSADSETVKNFGKPVDGFELTDGWCDTIMCQYADSGTMAAFLAAIKNPGSKLVIEYEGEADISLVLQVYENYTWEGFSTGTVADVDGTVKSKTFDCKAMIAALEAKTYEQDGQTLNCKIDRLMNFNVGGKGNTLRSVKVVGDVGPYELVLDIDKRYVDNGETLADGYEITDWNPSIITGYMSNGFIDTFKEAIQKENAVIAVTYTAGESAQTLRLYMQQGPLEGGTSYPGAEYNEALNIALDNGKNLAIFSCAGLIEKYTSTTHGDDPTVTLSVDKLHNFAVGGTGNTIYGVQVLVPTASTEPDPEEPDTNTSILLDIGPNVWALSKSEAIDISKSGTYTLKATAGTMDGNSDDTFIGLKSDKEDKSTELPDGTTITLKSVKLGDTAVTVTKGEETYTVKDGKLDFVLKLIAFDTNTNIFEGTLPSEFTTVEVTFVVNNPDDPLEPEVHEHTFDETKWEHDDTTHWHECTAKDCDKSEGYKTEPEEHTLTYVVNEKDATKHDVTCTVCGAVIETVAHTYKDGVCTLCKAEHDHTGEEIKYTDNENGTHKVEYTVCKLVKEAEDCTYDATTGKCTKCGAAKPAEEEECDHVGTERTYKVNEKDATKHDVICAKCKTVIETVAHTYENGVCTACEAKHDHTDEKITYVDKKDGTHTATYADCGLVETAKHTYKDGVCTLCESKHDHADEKVSYVDNKDGTHTATYADCGLTVEEKCTYDEKTGKCVCGAEKKVEVSTECKEEHKGWTIVDVSSYKDMDGNFYIDLTKTGKTGDLMSIHIIGTVTGTDAPRIFIANNGEWDNSFTGSYDHRLTVTDGVINYSADSFVLTAPKSGGDVASRIAFRDVKGLTITHLAYLFVDPTEEDPDAPTVPECTQDHEGWKIVDVTTYKNKSGEFNIPITGNVKAGDTLTVHIIGYATTAGRFYVANDEGSDHDLSGGRANVIDEKVKLDANGVFDYTTEPFTLYAPKSGSIVATRFIFKDSKALTITHFAYLVEHPESEPKGYEEDETLTNATVEAEDDSVVITPDGELKTEGLLVTFDGEGAPAAGTVVVNYVAEDGKETKVIDNPDGDAEIISDCKAPNDFFGKGGFWGRTAANALDITIDEIKALFEVDGAAFTFVYSGTPDGYYGGVPKVNLNGKFDNAALCKLTTLSDGKIQATVKLADILKASGVEVKDIENFLVQTCVQNFKIYSASFTVPGVASTAPVEFKAGKKYVEVPTDKNKTITSVVVSYEGAEAADIASVKLSSGKKTEDVSSKITLNGNAIRLGEDHHGFLYMGHIITLPHTFGDDNVCTICGYKRIVIEPTSKLIETEVKINDDTVNKLDKEVTVADGTAACSDDQFSILLPRAYSIGDEVKIHIKGSSDGDFRIWAADGGTTMSPEPLWKASENGFTSGNFDLEITLKIGDKDNSGKETANAVLFKGPSYGVKLSNFKLTYFAYYVEEEGDYKTSSNALYSLTTTGGQNFENKNLAGGLELETNDGRTRLATSWVGEGKVYDAMVNAFKANPEAVIKITYTGTITAFGIESENAGILDVANKVTEGQKYTVMTVKVADVLDTCKDAIADSSWRNIYVVAEDGAVLYGFEVVPA